MKERTQRALKLASNVGVGAAFLGLFNAFFTPIEEPLLGGRFTYVLLASALSYALFFLVVFPFEYLFRPTSDEPSMSLRFQGARKVIWPLVGLMTAAVIWLALKSR